MNTQQLNQIAFQMAQDEGERLFMATDVEDAFEACSDQIIDTGYNPLDLVGMSLDEIKDFILAWLKNDKTE